MEDVEVRNMNEVDECPDQDLGNVQSYNCITDSLKDGQRLRLFALCSESYFVMIYGKSGQFIGLVRHGPPGKDEWTADKKVDKRVCPKPSTTTRHISSLAFHLARAQGYKTTDRLVKVRRYRAVRTPRGKITRNPTPISKPWILILCSYSLKAASDIDG